MLQLHLYHLLENVQHETVIVDSFIMPVVIWASVPLTLPMAEKTDEGV